MPHLRVLYILPGFSIFDRVRACACFAASGRDLIELRLAKLVFALCECNGRSVSGAGSR